MQRGASCRVEVGMDDKLQSWSDSGQTDCVLDQLRDIPNHILDHFGTCTPDRKHRTHSKFDWISLDLIIVPMDSKPKTHQIGPQLCPSLRPSTLPGLLICPGRPVRLSRWRCAASRCRCDWSWRFGDIKWGDVSWRLRIVDDCWWFLMIFDDFSWLLMIFWWFLYDCWWFWMIFHEWKPTEASIFLLDRYGSMTFRHSRCSSVGSIFPKSLEMRLNCLETT